MGINDLLKIGDKIKEIRKSRGINQKEMASILSIPYSTYSNYENNNREPSRDLLVKIASVLDVDINTLLIPKRELSEEEESTLFYKVAELVALSGADSVKNALQSVSDNINNGYLTFSNSEPTDEEKIDMFISRMGNDNVVEIINMLAIKTAYLLSVDNYVDEFSECTTAEIIEIIKSTLLDIDNDTSVEYEKMVLLVINTLGLFNTLDVFDNYIYHFNEWNLIETILVNLQDTLYNIFAKNSTITFPKK